MFRNRVVFFYYDLLLQSHKVSCWHKSKELTYFLSSVVYLWGHRHSAQSCTSLLRGSKRHFDFVDRGCGRNNGKDKNSNYDFFFLLPGKALLQYDRLYDKWHIWKAVVVEDVTISWAANTQTWPFFFLRDAIVCSPDALTVSDVGERYRVVVKRTTSLDIFFISIF